MVRFERGHSHRFAAQLGLTTRRCGSGQDAGELVLVCARVCARPGSAVEQLLG